MGETKKRMVAEADDLLLSKLPEDLVMNILLCLPTKEAMATMILSKQWRYIWRKLPCFSFDIRDENCNNFGLILKKSLLLQELDEGRVSNNSLRTLSISIFPTSPCPKDFLLDLCNYIEKAATNHKVSNLELMFFWDQDPIQLPKTLYTCKTLVNLSLSNKILLDLSSSSNLPCLKTLHLCNVIYKDDESIVSLLSNCPVLEVLSVHRGVVDNAKKFMVKVSSLRKFSYFDFMWEVKDSDLVMDTPLLKRFKFTTCSSSALFKTKMVLDDGVVYIGEGCEFPDDNFLESMASLITLCMELTDVMVPCCNTVKFSGLRECNIIPIYSDWLNPIMSLLANSPKLKKLSIEHNQAYDDICWPNSWKEPSCVPKCLSSNFEELEWDQYGASQIEKQFITYILGNSICLKMVKISFFYEFQGFTPEKELRDIFRVSKTSHLVFT